MTGRFITSCILIFLLAVPSLVWGADDEASDNWSVLKVIQPQEKLFIKLRDHRKVKGKFNSVTDNMIFISEGDKNTGYGRQDILEVRLGHGRSLKKSILTGTLIGTGAGGGLGIATAAGENGFIDDKWFVVGGVIIGAIIGTTVGTVAGLFRDRGPLIYKAPDSSLLTNAE